MKPGGTGSTALVSSPRFAALPPTRGPPSLPTSLNHTTSFIRRLLQRTNARGRHYSRAVTLRQRGGGKIATLFHRDGLGQVARLVHVAAAPHRHVVGEQLQGDRGQDGRQQRRCRRQVDHAVRLL